MTPAANEESVPARKSRMLHIGSGDRTLAGWLNIDIKPYPGVDVVSDVTQGLKFRDVPAVYAEHFLEHLPIDKALDFLTDVHRVLAPDGWLRLSTPNLDWVWMTHYRLEGTTEEKHTMAFALNRAFRGWGHQFVWNPDLLDEALRCCGFHNLTRCRYGESSHDFFRNVEQHKPYADAAGVQHVIICEARKGPPQEARLAVLRDAVRESFLSHLDP